MEARVMMHSLNSQVSNTFSLLTLTSETATRAFLNNVMLGALNQLGLIVLLD